MCFSDGDAPGGNGADIVTSVNTIDDWFPVLFVIDGILKLCQKNFEKACDKDGLPPDLKPKEEHVEEGQQAYIDAANGMGFETGGEVYQM